MPKKKGYFGLFQSAKQDKTKTKKSTEGSLGEIYGGGQRRWSAKKKFTELEKERMRKEILEENRIKREEIRRKKEEEKRKKSRKKLPKNSGAEQKFRRKSEYS